MLGGTFALKAKNRPASYLEFALTEINVAPSTSSVGSPSFSYSSATAVSAYSSKIKCASTTALPSALAPTSLSLPFRSSDSFRFGKFSTRSSNDAVAKPWQWGCPCPPHPEALKNKASSPAYSSLIVRPSRKDWSAAKTILRLSTALCK